MRKMIIALTLSGAVLAAATGCATNDSTGTTDKPASGSNHQEDTGSSTASAESEKSESPSSENAVFGQTATFEGGIEVTVGKPDPFKPSQYAAADKAPEYLSFDITIVNNGTENYDPTMFSTTMQSGNTECDEVFDSAKGFEGSPQTKVLPGRETTFKIGYGVTVPDDLVMEVSPGFEYESAIFTS